MDDYRESDLKMAQNIREVLAQKALIGGRRGKRKSSKKGRGYTGGTTMRQQKAAAHARAMKKKYSKSKKSGKGFGDYEDYEEYEGGRRMSRRRSSKRGRGVLEGGRKPRRRPRKTGRGVLEGGRRPKRRVRYATRGRGYTGGVLTKEEKERLLRGDASPDYLQDLLGLEQTRMKNPDITLEDLYAQAIAELQIKQDTEAINAMKRIEQEQELLNRQTLLYEKEKDNLAMMVAQLEMSKAKSQTQAAEKLRGALGKLKKTGDAYNTAVTAALDLRPIAYTMVDSLGNPVYPAQKYTYSTGIEGEEEEELYARLLKPRAPPRAPRAPRAATVPVPKWRHGSESAPKRKPEEVLKTFYNIGASSGLNLSAFRLLLDIVDPLTEQAGRVEQEQEGSIDIVPIKKINIPKIDIPDLIDEDEEGIALSLSIVDSEIERINTEIEKYERIKQNKDEAIKTFSEKVMAKKEKEKLIGPHLLAKEIAEQNIEEYERALQKLNENRDVFMNKLTMLSQRSSIPTGEFSRSTSQNIEEEQQILAGPPVHYYRRRIQLQ